MVKEKLGRTIKRLKNKYLTSAFFRGFFDKISGSWLYHLVSRERIKRIIKSSPPFNLLIETTNFCNARCVMCPNQFMKRKKRVMNSQVFKKIVDRIKKEKLAINKVYLSGFGEPLTDKKFLSRLKRLKSLGLTVSFYTNASFLTETIARRLIELKVDEVNISFNGVTPHQYQQIMNLDYEKTVNNINTFLKLKKNMGARLPFIRISSIIIKENQKDIDKHLKKWAATDLATVSQAHQWGIKMSNVKSQISNVKVVYPCRSLWHTIAVDSSGNFIVCCRDYESKYVLGSVMKNSFHEIMNSSILNSFKEKHLSFDEAKLPPMCRGCNFPFQNGVEWWLPRSAVD